MRNEKAAELRAKYEGMVREAADTKNAAIKEAKEKFKSDVKKARIACYES